MSALGGYWAFTAADNSSTFYRCVRSTYCTGGQQQCALHRTGTLCALCVSGYELSSLDGSCVSCAGGAASSWTAFVAVLGAIAFGVVLYKVAEKRVSLRKKEEARIEANAAAVSSPSPSTPRGASAGETSTTGDSEAAAAGDPAAHSTWMKRFDEMHVDAAGHQVLSPEPRAKDLRHALENCVRDERV